jgi:hypothetical protein
VRPTEEILEDCERNAVRTRELAASHFERGAHPLAAVVWSESAVNYLMRAMLAWRASLDDPRPWLDACVDVSEDAVSSLASQPGFLRTFNRSPGAYSALLRDRVSSPVVAAAALAEGGPGTTPPLEVLLDAILIRILVEHDPDSVNGADGAATPGRLALLRRTFDTYVELARAGNDPTERVRLTSAAVANFRARRRDGFYASGQRAEGGGDYNALLVDYRLAAIWRRNRWPKSGLDADARQHLLPDAD